MEKETKFEKKEYDETDESGYLMPREKYLEAGCHIGTKFKTGSMKEYIYRRRKDRLFVMDIAKIDEQLRKAADYLAKYEPKDIAITAVRAYASGAAAKMSIILGSKIIPKRFGPGTFTNPEISYFMEPKLLFVCDPKAEAEAIREAKLMKIPIISLCDTENETGGIDVVIPCNNKGKRSIALIFYVLTREYMMKKNMIKSYNEFNYRSRDFEDLEALRDYGDNEEAESAKAEAKPAPVVPAKKADDAAKNADEKSEAPAAPAAEPEKKPARKRKETTKE